jgi:hypothetical protein
LLATRQLATDLAAALTESRNKRIDLPISDSCNAAIAASFDHLIGIGKKARLADHQADAMIHHASPRN